MPIPARTREILLKRVRRLLRLDRGSHDQSELTMEIIPFLRSIGSVALIGGAIRDVARAGKRGFSSDLDFVIYGSDRDAFVAQMDISKGIRNRFGGYAINRFKLKIDVWHIEDTWARTAGLATVMEPADLLKCTFFDWDSAVYEIDAGKLILPSDYFDRLLLNVMDIRLEENPNPMGSLVRALRRAASWHVKFGPRLTAFSRRCLDETRWEELVSLDATAFSRPILKYLDRENLIRRLQVFTTTRVGDVTLPVPEPQLSLPFDEATSLSPFF
jgi:hypothetical protein